MSHTTKGKTGKEVGCVGTDLSSEWVSLAKAAAWFAFAPLLGSKNPSVLCALISGRMNMSQIDAFQSYPPSVRSSQTKPALLCS